MSDDNLRRVESAFDAAAPIFASRNLNPIVAWTRRQNLALLEACFPPKSHLIELGCGTGEDAVALAADGHYIFGIDLSGQMVQAAARRVADAGMNDRVVVVRGKFTDLESLLAYSPWKDFDGAYASFSLFTEDELSPVVLALHKVLPPGGIFACTLGNRLPLAEAASYAIRLQPRHALQRLVQPRAHEVYGRWFRIREYFPAETKRAFSGYFRLRELVGLPVFLPPVYLKGFYERLGGAQALVQGIDRSLAPHFPWKYLGENTFYCFEREAG